MNSMAEYMEELPYCGFLERREDRDCQRFWFVRFFSTMSSQTAFKKAFLHTKENETKPRKHSQTKYLNFKYLASYISFSLFELGIFSLFDVVVVLLLLMA